MAPHSSTLAWKIPWTEEPGGLQSMGSLRVGHDWATSFSLFTFMHWRRKWQPTPVFLRGESQGRGSLVGCRLWGHRVGHYWIDLAAAAAAASNNNIELQFFEHVHYLISLKKNNNSEVQMRRLRLKLCNLDKFMKCVRIRADLDFSGSEQFLATLSLEA